MRETKVKNQRAITLIALVITIIVMLILAGVSIATLTGENGILTQARNAKEATGRKEVIERAQVDVLGVQSNNNGKLTKAQFREILGKFFKEDTLPKEEELPDDMSTATQKITAKEEYGGYEIKIVEIWNGKFSTGSEGNTVAELYDGINNPEDEEYNENAMHIGDWVNYTAGIWDIDEGIPTPTENEPFTFGGYNARQSRDTNANGVYTGSRENAKYEGWRIWDIDKENGTITLISAGCPEEFYQGYQMNDAYISEYILSGNINANVDKDAVGLETTYTKRNWNIYMNAGQYANSAEVLTKSKLDKWYKKYINNSINDTIEVSRLPENNENKLISIVENQCYYWLSSGCVTGGYFMFSDFRNIGDSGGGAAFGVRILVSLTSEVKFEGTPEKVEYDEFTYNKWKIKTN